jgi:hypothetical protein
MARQRTLPDKQAEMEHPWTRNSANSCAPMRREDG